MNIKKQKTDPLDNKGWSYNYEFLNTISKTTDERTYSADMEQVESVLMALEIYYKNN